MDAVGFQGEGGAFSEEAALALFGSGTRTQGYRTFDGLVEAVAAGAAAYGVLPCENTIYGSIARAYDLLRQYELAIVDETTHRIEQCLIGLPGAAPERIDLVMSHPVALEQCRVFLSEHPRMEARVADDTAGAVREIVDRGDPRLAAIGPALAARRYGAHVLQPGIQDDRDNVTRFFVVAAQPQSRRSLGRACIALTLPHRSGSLSYALAKVAERDLNLRSLVARPTRQRAFEYTFYLEIDAPPHVDVDALAASLAEDSRVLGRY